MDKNRIKHIIYYVFWVVICLGIIGAATYPFISDYLLSQKQMQQIERFDKKDSKTSKQDYLSAFYQRRAKQKTVTDPFAQAKKDKTKSNSVDVAKSQLNTIGVLAIPKIKEILPIYDNTSSIALDNGIGLLEHTSDITGGKGKHAVLTGHSGLSLNKLFTDLPKVKKGDEFYIKVNGEVHAYKVDQIKTVLPTNMKYLKVDPNKDYVTLVTCTPLFVNTHRLLVRGHRVPYHKANIETDGGVTSLGKAVLVGTGIMTIMLIIAYLIKRRKREKLSLVKNEVKKGLRKV